MPTSAENPSHTNNYYKLGYCLAAAADLWEDVSCVKTSSNATRAPNMPALKIMTSSNWGLFDLHYKIRKTTWEIFFSQLTTALATERTYEEQFTCHAESFLSFFPSRSLALHNMCGEGGAVPDPHELCMTWTRVLHSYTPANMAPFIPQTSPVTWSNQDEYFLLALPI